MLPVISMTSKRSGSMTLIHQLNVLLFLFIILLGIVLIAHIQRVKIRKTHVSLQRPPIQKVHANKEVFTAKAVRVPILMYHYVENVTDLNDTFRMSMNIPPDIFEKQIITLQENGFTFLTMKELTTAFKQNTELPEKPIILTFDDGYKDFYDVVFPLLKKHTVKAVAYIAPGLLDTPNYMNKEHVIEIAKSGIVEVASHTVSHANLSGASLPVAYYEIYESKRLLENIIAEEVVSFAYPYGGFDNQAAQIVQQAGYATAVSTQPGVEITNENMYAITRIRPGMRVGEELLRYLRQDSFTEY